ncbi:MAG: DUF2384 domain-containing protein [Deltaproteobacteria bacterium]|nr:DUF2384 domain-containing protein [Deltaproteobacteria bacterium]
MQAVKVNEGLELQDLVSGQSVFIRERLGTRSIKRFDLLLAPVITFDDQHEMTGGSALVPRVHREVVLKALRKGADVWRRRRPEASLREQLRGSLLPAFQALREAYANVRLPEIRNSDGDEIVYSTATYKVLDEAGVYERLDAHPVFEQTAEDEEETIYNWSGETENASFSTGPVDLGTIRIRKDTLLLETNSRERLEEGKELLAEVLGEAIRHQDDEFKDLETTLAENRARKESGEADETDSDDGIPPEVKAEIIGNFYRDHFKRWVDMAIPALGGATPRQAVKTAAGRERVIEMLKDQENRLARNPDGGGVDFTEVYRDLGLKRWAK